MNPKFGLPFVLFVTINFLLNGSAEAGVVKRSVRMVREIYPPDVETDKNGNPSIQVCIVGDVVYGAEETVPAEQSCLKCRCQPPGVQCETVQCTKKPGCKAIHRPNKCCPDYQCECEHNGKIYANGEKLETHPGGECKVCYCRGGEIQCAEVSCYLRNDCEGKRVPGTCCPKYDHCPPIDTVSERTTLRPLTEAINSTKTGLGTIFNNNSEENNKVPDTSDLATGPPIIQEEVHLKEEPLLHKITIQEIIPERKEIPITAPPKIFVSEPQGTLVIEEALPTNDNNDLQVDSEPESSEVSQVFQHPPPVLRIGDKLLFLKQDTLVSEKDTTTPDSVITLIGAEGLQRGGFEDSLEVHEANASKTEEAINDLELKSEETSHILSLVKRKKVLSTTTMATTTQKEEILSTSSPEISDETTTLVEILVTSTESPKTSVAGGDLKELEQNPSYPPIPDVMPVAGEPLQKLQSVEPSTTTTISVEDTTSIIEISTQTESPVTIEEGKMILLPEVLDAINKTEPNQTHAEWLKQDTDSKPLTDFTAGTLPEELLKAKAPIDEDEETVSTTTEAPTTTRSVESVEIDSGEQTTPKVNLTNSITTPAALQEAKESFDMTNRKDSSLELGSIEVSDLSQESRTVPQEFEHINEKRAEPEMRNNSNGSMKDDVELIDILNIPKPTKIIKTETSTFEFLPTPEETKAIIKRSIRDDDDDDDVFKDLERELQVDSDQIPNKNVEEERREADEIFKELNAEIQSNGKKDLNKPKSKEQESIDNISNALAGIALRGQIPDANVFRLIGGLFGGQRGQ